MYSHDNIWATQFSNITKITKTQLLFLEKVLHLETTKVFNNYLIEQAQRTLQDDENSVDDVKDSVVAVAIKNTENQCY
jgi:hypothetical protein